MGKGGSSSPPPAPDPTATANAQAAANSETARTQARLNRIDQYTPMGTQTFTDLGNDRWRSDISLSPEQQGLYNSQTQAQQGLFGLANQAIPKVGQAFNTQLDFSGLPDPVAQGRDIASSARAVGDQIYQTGRDRLSPDFGRQIEDMKQDLANRGIPIGSDAYGSAQRAVYNSQNDTLSQLAANAQAASTAQLQGQTSLAQALRQQGIQEQSLLRSQPIDDVSRLLGLSGQPSVPQFSQIAPVNVAPTDVIGPTNQAYQAQLAGWQANQNRQNSTAGGLFGLAGSALGGWAQAGFPGVSAALGFISDRRVKENIRRVGTTDGGLPIYVYNLLGDPRAQMGVMAQELEVVDPAAVIEIGGLKHVDYARVR